MSRLSTDLQPDQSAAAATGALVTIEAAETAVAAVAAAVVEAIAITAAMITANGGVAFTRFFSCSFL